MAWALSHGYVVLTHDLDFSALLAATGADGPSVIQVRTQDVLSPEFALLLTRTLNTLTQELESGAIVTIDQNRARARVLPLARD